MSRHSECRQPGGLAQLVVVGFEADVVAAEELPTRMAGPRRRRFSRRHREHRGLRNLSPAQVFMIMNPQMISERRPWRVRKGLVVKGKQAMTPSDGMAGRSRRTEHGDAIAAAIAPLLPPEHLPTADLPDDDRACPLRIPHGASPEHLVLSR